MQKNFTPSVTLIEHKNLVWQGSSREQLKKFEKRTKNQNLDLSEGHKFLCQKKITVIAYAKGALHNLFCRLNPKILIWEGIFW